MAADSERAYTVRVVATYAGRTVRNGAEPDEKVSCRRTVTDTLIIYAFARKSVARRIKIIPRDLIAAQTL